MQRDILDLDRTIRHSGRLVVFERIRGDIKSIEGGKMCSVYHIYVGKVKEISTLYSIDKVY